MYVIGGALWAASLLICACEVWASARDERRRERSAPAPPVSLDLHTLPPGDGCSISDYYFEYALD